MRSAAPTIVNAAFCGGVVNDYDQRNTKTVQAGANYYAVPASTVLWGDVAAGHGDTRLQTATTNRAARVGGGKVLRAFEVQMRLEWRQSTSLTGPVQTWGAPAGAGHLWVEWYAVDEAATAAITLAARSSAGASGEASDAVEAAVEGGRLLDVTGIVERVPVTWTIQPGERIVAIARWSGWDGESVSASAAHWAVLFANVSLEQEA